MNAEERFAVYYVPAPGSPFAEFGAGLLGYDIETGKTRRRLTVQGVPVREVTKWTHKARRYGFHATIKAPFRLANGSSSGQLRRAIDRIARAFPPFHLPPLEVGTIGHFLALRPHEPSREIDELARACVEELDRFRALMSSEEFTRRQPESLSTRQRAHLQRWGYPYVLDEYRFHFTLTDTLDGWLLAKAREILCDASSELCRRSIKIEALALVHESRVGAGFRVCSRFPLRRSARHAVSRAA